MIAVFLGPPGVGKGTQATMLCDAHGWLHLSSGEMVRKEMAMETARGRDIAALVASGRLVPDELMLSIILDTILSATDHGGVLLDGFPRTLPQAQALDSALLGADRRVDRALLLLADVEHLVARMPGRLTCRRCQAVYHTDFHPPRTPGVCDRCGGPLYRRDDDDEATVRRRMEIYSEQTQPLVAYYEQRGILVQVDGDQPIDDVYRQLDGLISGAAV